MFFRFILECFVCKSEKDQNHPHAVGGKDSRQAPPRLESKLFNAMCHCQAQGHKLLLHTGSIFGRVHFETVTCLIGLPTVGVPLLRNRGGSDQICPTLWKA